MKQTAVEWLIEQVALNEHEEGFFLHTFLSNEEILKAKQMEKEQIMKTARQCHFQGVTQSAKTGQEYIDYSEQYYNETYGK
jgi:hypothetical protein